MNKFRCFQLTMLMVVASVWSFGETTNNYEPVLQEKVVSNIENLVRKDNQLQQLPILNEGQVYIPTGADPEYQKKLIRVAAYDVGSTGVKFKLVDIDPSNHQIIHEIYSKTIKTKFKIEENDFIDRIATIAGLKTLVEQYFPHYTQIKHNAIATAGFRAAGELGLRLAQEIAEITGIDFRVIDQDEEGLLAFYGITTKNPAFNPAIDVVWDVGGGSSQLVSSENTEGKDILRFFGISVGSSKFNKIIINSLYGEDETNINRSVNPISLEKIEEFINLAKIWLTLPDGPFKPVVFTQDDINFIKSKIANGGKVYGAGAHYPVPQAYVANNIAYKEYYTKEEIFQLLKLIANKDDTYIYNHIKKDNKSDFEWIKSDVTVLMLIYAMMDVFGMDKIYPIDITNTDGIAIQTAINSDQVDQNC